MCSAIIFNQSIHTEFLLNIWTCYQMQGHMLNPWWSQTNQNIRVWSRERFITGPCKERVACAPKTPSPQRISAGLLKASKGGVWLVVENFLVLKAFVVAVVPVTMFLSTSNKTNVILGSVIFYLYMDGFFKVKALRMGSPVCFRLWAAFFYERCRASMTKQATEHKG